MSVEQLKHPKVSVYGIKQRVRNHKNERHFLVITDNTGQAVRCSEMGEGAVEENWRTEQQHGQAES